MNEMKKYFNCEFAYYENYMGVCTTMFLFSTCNNFHFSGNSSPENLLDRHVHHSTHSIDIIFRRERQQNLQTYSKMYIVDETTQES